MRKFLVGTLAVLAAILPPAIAEAGSLVVEGETFVLTTDDGRHLTSADLVGAALDTFDASGAPMTLRIDAVTPAKERPSLLLHEISIRDAATGNWVPFCQTDAHGRHQAFPVAGAFDGHGHYSKRTDSWFLTCTSGSQGKCILFGYDPWTPGPHGEDLAPYYQACQHMVRADYDGHGIAHTRNGTLIDVFDRLGIQASDSRNDPNFSFEAAWGPDGAVCVARTRWPDLLPRATLMESAPRLDGRCDEASATAKGALLFNRSK